MSALTLLADPIVTLGGTAVPNEGQISSRPGITNVDFNAGFPVSGAIQYSGWSASNLVTGGLSGQYAAPTGDTSQYLTVGPSAGNLITITSSNLLNYFGFYASSVDDYNVINFYNGSTLVLSLNGTTLATLGGFSPNGAISTFVNIESSSAAEYFNRIELTSSSNAFETDNHAFGAVDAQVPEPSTTLLFGAAGAGLLLIRSRKR